MGLCVTLECVAKSNAERQRDFRGRQREKHEADRRATAVMPVAEHEAKLERYKARVAEWRDSQLEVRQALEAEISRLSDALGAAHADLVSIGKCCPACGGPLACPACARSQYGDDF
jgi:hypothetical protein